MNVTVYCGSHVGNDPAFERCAADVGAWIARHGHTLVYGGGGVGLMGVVSGAVLDAGGRVVGVIPRFLLRTERPNRELDELHVTETMWERKMSMIELGDAFIALPGGPGTLEEITEVISLAKLSRVHGPVVLFDCNGYYQPLLAVYDDMVASGFLSAEQRGRFCAIEQVDELDGLLGRPRVDG